MLVANIALLCWPLVALYLFVKLPFERAIIWSVVISFLFLPNLVAIDLPGVPALDRWTLPSLIMLVLALFKAPRRFRLLPKHALCKLLLIALLLGTVGTALSNQDLIFPGGDRVLQGASMYDAASESVRTVLTIAPFLLGWQYLSSAQSHETILKILVSIGLVYSILMLAEVRLSPQLHTWVYGYRQFDFSQQFRAGGFRPVVFLPHGLWTAFFAMTITVAAAALWRQGQMDKGSTAASTPGASNSYLYLSGYFGIVLVLCKSLGSLVFGAFLAPIVLLTKPKSQLRIAVVLVTIAMTYPLLRGGSLVPIDSIRDLAQSYSAERAQSLEVRLENEDRMLEHASQRPFFGWGGWGRSRVYDPRTGKDVTITDGYWIIAIGTYGWVGYIGLFGLLGVPVIAVWRRIQKDGNASLTPATSALCLLLGINMIEMLPNTTLPPWTWLIAGSLLGFATRTAKEEVKPLRSEPNTKRPRTVL